MMISSSAYLGAERIELHGEIYSVKAAVGTVIGPDCNAQSVSEVMAKLHHLSPSLRMIQDVSPLKNRSKTRPSGHGGHGSSAKLRPIVGICLPILQDIQV